MAALLSDRKDFCGNGSHFESLSTSDFASDGIRLQSFRYGEAAEEERELSILVPVADEVEAYTQYTESGVTMRRKYFLRHPPASA